MFVHNHSQCFEMLEALQRNGIKNPFYKTISVLARQFSILENKLSFIDALGEEVDRNGLLLPPIGSLVSYSTQRQYRVGIYCGKKNIDGLQKLQVRNEHDCIHDVLSFCLLWYRLVLALSIVCFLFQQLFHLLSRQETLSPFMMTLINCTDHQNCRLNVFITSLAGMLGSMCNRFFPMYLQNGDPSIQTLSLSEWSIESDWSWWLMGSSFGTTTSMLKS